MPSRGGGGLGAKAKSAASKGAKNRAPAGAAPPLLDDGFPPLTAASSTRKPQWPPRSRSGNDTGNEPVADAASDEAAAASSLQDAAASEPPPAEEHPDAADNTAELESETGGLAMNEAIPVDINLGPNGMPEEIAIGIDAENTKAADELDVPDEAELTADDPEHTFSTDNGSLTQFPEVSANGLDTGALCVPAEVSADLGTAEIAGPHDVHAGNVCGPDDALDDADNDSGACDNDAIHFGQDLMSDTDLVEFGDDSLPPACDSAVLVSDEAGAESGPVLDESVLTAMKVPKERIFLLKLESHIISNLRNDKIERIKLTTPISPYLRRLVHLVSDYYGLQREVHQKPGEKQKATMTLLRTSRTCIPERTLSVICEQKLLVCGSDGIEVTKPVAQATQAPGTSSSRNSSTGPDRPGPSAQPSSVADDVAAPSTAATPCELGIGMQPVPLVPGPQPQQPQQPVQPVQPGLQPPQLPFQVQQRSPPPAPTAPAPKPGAAGPPGTWIVAPRPDGLPSKAASATLAPPQPEVPVAGGTVATPTAPAPSPASSVTGDEVEEEDAAPKAPPQPVMLPGKFKIMKRRPSQSPDRGMDRDKAASNEDSSKIDLSRLSLEEREQVYQQTRARIFGESSACASTEANVTAAPEQEEPAATSSKLGEEQRKAAIDMKLAQARNNDRRDPAYNRGLSFAANPSAALVGRPPLTFQAAPTDTRPNRQAPLAPGVYPPGADTAEWDLHPDAGVLPGPLPVGPMPPQNPQQPPPMNDQQLKLLQLQQLQQLQQLTQLQPRKQPPQEIQQQLMQHQRLLQQQQQALMQQQRQQQQPQKQQLQPQQRQPQQMQQLQQLQQQHNQRQQQKQKQQQQAQQQAQQQQQQRPVMPQIEQLEERQQLQQQLQQQQFLQQQQHFQQQLQLQLQLQQQQYLLAQEELAALQQSMPEQ